MKLLWRMHERLTLARLAFANPSAWAVGVILVAFGLWMYLVPSDPRIPPSVPTEADEATIYQIAHNYLSDRNKNRSDLYYLAVERVQVQGDWAIVFIVGRHSFTNELLPAGGGLMIAHREDGAWAVARWGDVHYQDWLTKLPPSLMSEEAKSRFR